MSLIEKIRSNLSDLDLYREQFPNLTMDDINRQKKFHSCFNNEKTPSMSFKKGKDGRIFFNDYSSGKHGDIFDFIAEKNNLNMKNDPTSVLKFINEKYQLNLIGGKKTHHNQEWQASYFEDFTPAAKTYFSKHFINEEVVTELGVRQLKKLIYRGKEGKTSTFLFEKNNQIAFDFNVEGRHKLYVPKQAGIDKKYFIKTQKRNDTFGSRKRKEKYEFLLLCEGEKDVLVAISNGIPARCLQSANTELTGEIMKGLKTIAKEVIVCYDNDEPGRRGANRICERWELPNLKLEDSQEGEDLADYCQRHQGLDRIKRNIEESIFDFKMNNNLNVWEIEGGYSYKKKSKSGIYENIPISNFTIENEAFIEGEHESKRIIKIISKQRKTESFAVSTDGFTSVSNFKRLLEEKGPFFFFGNEMNLLSLKKYIFSYAHHSKEVNYLGYNTKHDSFILSNAVLQNGSVHYPNKLGIVGDIYIPSSAVENKFNADFGTDRKYTFRRGDTKIAEWFHGIGECYGATGKTFGVPFIFCSLFDDIISQHENIPHLHIWGQRGSGKNSFVKMLLNLFGKNFEPTSLQNATPTGITRKMAHTANIPQWFDEFNNNLPPRTIEVLKNFYDRIGKTMGLKTTDTKTNQTKIRTTSIITGQELVSMNEALMSRTILIQFDQVKDNQERNETFLKWKTKFEKGLGQILEEFLKYRKIVEKEFLNKTQEVSATLSKYFISQKLKVDIRLIKNYAVVISPILIAIENGLPLFGEDVNVENELKVFMDVVFENIEQQARDESQQDEVNIFWETLDRLIQAQKIKERVHYFIDKDKNEIGFTAFVLDEYTKYFKQVNDQKSPDRSSIIRYLKLRNYFKDYKKVYYRKGEFDDSKKQIKSYICTLSKLPLEIRELFVDDEKNDDDEF